MSSLIEQVILDAKELKEAAVKSAEQMIIEKYAEENSGDLVLIPLAERARKIQEKYENNQVSTQLALQELFAILENEVKRKEEDKTGDSLKLFIEDILKDKNVKDFSEISSQLLLPLSINDVSDKARPSRLMRST